MIYYILLFILGAAFGSFLNVLATRYNPDKFLLNPSVIGGRSFCNYCHSELKWFELAPILSFMVIRGRCRNCGRKLSWQYLISEILTGLIFISVPYGFKFSSFSFNLSSLEIVYLSVFWILVFSTLLLVSLIDIRLKLIPNEANLFLGILGVIIAFAGASNFGLVSGSFLGHYASLFGLRDNLLINRLVGLFAGTVFLGFLIFITRGRGMGIGDLKLIAALGLIFGWPDVVLILMIAFIIGSIFSLGLIIKGKKTLKSSVPFGPFLALAALIIFFFGRLLLDGYFRLFNIWV